MNSPVPFHRIFGLNLTDFFFGCDVVVEVEKELTQKQQFLDVVIIRKGSAPIPRRLPDGFDELAPHNLITFKSYRETLDGWALIELLGHYASYRKIVSPFADKLLSESHFRLYAVCARHPQKLEDAGLLRPAAPGVFDAVLPGIATIRMIVVHGLPLEEQNAILHLFSAKPESLQYACEHYHPQSSDTNTLLYRLLQTLRRDLNVTIKYEEFVRESLNEILESLPPEELRKHLTPEERLEGITPEKRLEGLSTEQLKQILRDLERRLRANDSSSDSQ